MVKGIPPMPDEGAPIIVSIFNNPVFNKDILKSGININSLPDDELYTIVKESYSKILEDLFNGVGEIYKSYFQNERFLNIFIRALQQQKSFSAEQRTYCNHLTYDYLTLPGASKYMKELFLVMSKTVNRDIIPGLMSIGLEESLATKIALARYSCFDEVINIKRVNVILINALDPDSTDAEDIVKIYCKLFEHLSVLFNTVMFSKLEMRDDTQELSQEDIDMIEVDGLLGLAVLDILVTQPLEIIRGVLIRYAEEFARLYNSDKKYIRFSLRTLSEDYNRIFFVIQELSEDYYIP